MATNYIASTDVDAVIGSGLRQALFTEEGSAYSSTHFSRACELASIAARAALENAGYSTGDTTSNDMVTMTALAFFFQMAFARKKLDIPAGVQAVFGGIPEGVRIGEIPVPGLDPNADEAVGSAEFTDSSETSTTGKPTVYGDLRSVF